MVITLCSLIHPHSCILSSYLFIFIWLPLAIFHNLLHSLILGIENGGLLTNMDTKLNRLLWYQLRFLYMWIAPKLIYPFNNICTYVQTNDKILFLNRTTIENELVDTILYKLLQYMSSSSSILVLLIYTVVLLLCVRLS